MAGSQAHPLIEVRLLEHNAEFAEAVRLQQDIWGFADIDLLPVRLFVVARHIGGHVFGAFDSGRMIGFCLAIPGLKPGGRFYLHSHMLGVLDGYRNAGVGRLLKLAQREDALARGIRLIEWTFDPLETKNAYFNLERLGAIVNRYVLNQYGITTSRLNAGLPTDRCVAEWYVDSPRVSRILSGDPPPRAEVVERIEVPGSIDTLRRDDPARAREIQRGISEKFQQCFARGLTATGLERSSEASAYLLTAKWPSE
jgi:predicted GNAT superfamily acetyltransferase